MSGSVLARTPARPTPLVLAALLVSFLLLSLSSASLAAAHGSTVEMGSGTFTDTTASYIPESVSGATTYFAVSGTGTITGALTGTYAFSGTLQANDQTARIHYSLTDVFTVTVDGRAGTITVSEVGEGSAATSTFASQFVVLSGTGCLADLSGQGMLRGTQVGMLDSGTYTFTYSFS